MVSFVDGHVALVKVYWERSKFYAGFCDPPRRLGLHMDSKLNKQERARFIAQPGSSSGRADWVSVTYR